MSSATMQPSILATGAVIRSWHGRFSLACLKQRLLQIPSATTRSSPPVKKKHSWQLALHLFASMPEVKAGAGYNKFQWRPRLVSRKEGYGNWLGCCLRPCWRPSRMRVFPVTMQFSTGTREAHTGSTPCMCYTPCHMPKSCRIREARFSQQYHVFPKP